MTSYFTNNTRLLVTITSAKPAPWENRHNLAVAEYFSGNANRDAKRTLDMLMTMASFTDTACGYSVSNIIVPLSNALSDALSMDLGGLDGGTISKVQHQMLQHLQDCGWDIEDL